MIDMDEGFYKTPALPTAGAITVRDAKGRLVTKKVKVRRHIAGEIPEYAQREFEEDDEIIPKTEVKTAAVALNEEKDNRLRRLEGRQIDDEDRISRHRRIAEPEIVEEASEEENDEEEQEQEQEEEDETDRMDLEDSITKPVKMDLESSEDDEDLDEDAIERRRQRVRMKAKQREEELLQIEEEKEAEQEEFESSEESESEEEEDEEEDEDGVPRLKPIFVPKDDRRTIAEREAEEKRQIQMEIEKKRLADRRKMESHHLVEKIIREEKLKEKEAGDGISCDFDTDDEEPKSAYDAWKLRELKRLKRDREERDQREKEQQDIERWRNMTEAERQAERQKNPKFIDNAAPKEKYRFLQKYYHRGAFFMDKDDEIFKRNFAQPTLEDHFDKTVLPKVMQVKNFGMAGRTKYTHLVDQDTTERDKSKFLPDNRTMMKFHQEHGGGMKSVFERPKLKKASKK